MLRRAISSSLSRRLKVRTLKGLIGGHSRCEINKGYRFSSTRDLMDDRMDVDPAPLFQLASDLHVEFLKPDRLDSVKIEPTGAPYLVLAGDIGVPQVATYALLLQRESARFKRVFVVAGNHEFYRGEYNSVKHQIHEICGKFSNVTFLDKTSVWLSECQVRLLGATLWSHVPPENEVAVGRSLNDYAMITIQSRKFKVADSNQIFQEESAWLAREIGEARARGEQRVVVVTHHAPLLSGTSAPEHDGSEINCAFSTDMSYLMGDPVKLWMFGHTHYSSDQTVGGTRVVSNQQGYLFTREKAGYRPNFTLSL